MLSCAAYLREPAGSRSSPFQPPPFSVFYILDNFIPYAQPVSPACPVVYSPCVRTVQFQYTVIVPNVYLVFFGPFILPKLDGADFFIIVILFILFLFFFPPHRGSYDQHQLFCCPHPPSSVLQDVCGI